jgi:hypothetical protein
VRLVLARGTPRRTVRVSYAPPAAPQAGAGVMLRVSGPRPAWYTGAPNSGSGSIDVPDTGGAAPEPAPGGGTVTIPAPAAGGRGTLVMIGDSLALGMKQLLPAALPGWRVTIDARIGRPLTEGMQILERTRLPRGAVLAMGLFTNNDPWRLPELRAAVARSLQRAGPDGCVIWATISAPPINGVSYAKANALLNALGAQDARLRIVPWAEQVAATPQILIRDRVHPTAQGSLLRARLYGQAAASCAS